MLDEGGRLGFSCQRGGTCRRLLTFSSMRLLLENNLASRTGFFLRSDVSLDEVTRLEKSSRQMRPITGDYRHSRHDRQFGSIPGWRFAVGSGALRTTRSKIMCFEFASEFSLGYRRKNLKTNGLPQEGKVENFLRDAGKL